MNQSGRYRVVRAAKNCTNWELTNIEIPMLHFVGIYKNASGEQIRAEASPPRQCIAVESKEHRHWQVSHTVSHKVSHTDTDRRQVQCSSSHTLKVDVKREAIHNMYLLLLIALPVPSLGQTLNHFSI